VDAQLVHDDNVARRKWGKQNLLDLATEHGRVSRAFDRPDSAEPGTGQRAQDDDITLKVGSGNGAAGLVDQDQVSAPVRGKLHAVLLAWP
jgi:hypothetical protein